MKLFGKKNEAPLDSQKFAQPAAAGKAGLADYQMAQVRLREFLVGRMGETGLEPMVDKIMETALAHTYSVLADRLGDENLSTLDGLSIDQIQERAWAHQIDLYQLMTEKLNEQTTTLASQFGAITGKSMKA